MSVDDFIKFVDEYENLKSKYDELVKEWFHNQFESDRCALVMESSISRNRFARSRDEMRKYQLQANLIKSDLMDMKIKLHSITVQLVRYLKNLVVEFNDYADLHEREKFVDVASAYINKTSLKKNILVKIVGGTITIKILAPVFSYMVEYI